MSLFPTSGIHNYRYPELSARFFSSQFSMITGYCLFHGRQPDAVMQDILFRSEISAGAVFSRCSMITVAYTDLEHFLYIGYVKAYVPLPFRYFPTGFQCIFKQVPKNDRQMTAPERKGCRNKYVCFKFYPIFYRKGIFMVYQGIHHNVTASGYFRCSVTDSVMEHPLYEQFRFFCFPLLYCTQKS